MIREDEKDILKIKTKDLSYIFKISEELSLVINNNKLEIQQIKEEILPLDIISKINSLFVYIGINTDNFKKMLFDSRNERFILFKNNNWENYIECIISQAQSFELFYKLLSNFTFQKWEISPSKYVKSLAFYRVNNLDKIKEYLRIGNIGEKLEYLVDTNIDNRTIDKDIFNKIYLEYHNFINNKMEIPWDLAKNLKYNNKNLLTVIKNLLFKDTIYLKYSISYNLFDYNIKSNCQNIDKEII